MTDVLMQLAAVIDARKSADPAQSYVASLQAKGLDKILEKVGEEAFETVLAAKNLGQSSDADRRQALVHETADLWFHTLVMLSHLELGPEVVLEELRKRFTISGLAEKASRGH